jgi:hypothetical protein
MALAFPYYYPAMLLFREMIGKSYQPPPVIPGRAFARTRNLEIPGSMLRIGVLIYLLLADRDFEIVADRGIDTRVGRAGLEKICVEMVKDFRA